MFARGRTCRNSDSLLEKAARLDPLNGLIELDWARALIDSGSPRQALPHLQRAVTMAAIDRIRGFKPVAVEAAALALRAAGDASFTPAQQAACRSRAMQWMQEDLTRWKVRVDGDDPIDHSAASQVLARILNGSPATRLNSYRLSSVTRNKLPGCICGKRWKHCEQLPRRKRLPADTDLVEYFLNPAINRKIAEWVLNNGGEVVIRDTWDRWHEVHARRLADLTAGPFAIIKVSLSGCPVSDADLPRLSYLGSLSELWLDGTRVTDAGVNELLDKLLSLELLSVENTQVGDAGLAVLPELQELYLRGSQVSRKKLAALRERNPKLILVTQTLTDANIDQANSSSFAIAVQQGCHFPVTYESDKPVTLETWVSVPARIHQDHVVCVAGDCRVDGTSKALLCCMFRSRREFTLQTHRSEREIYYSLPRTPRSYLTPVVPQHIAVVYDGSEYRAYVNGKLSGQASDIKQPSVPYTFQIGNLNPRYAFSGPIDEIRISSVARYQGEFTPARRHESDEHTLALSFRRGKWRHHPRFFRQ